MKNINRVFLIGIGGTGMRCLESFIHTCAMGMYDGIEVEMLALDTDHGNGNFDRVRRLCDLYNKINGGNTKSDTFFSAKINFYEFSPGYDDNDSFATIAGYSNINDSTRDFLELFIDPDLRNMNLKHGYRAQTQLGSLLMFYAIEKAAYEAANGIRSKGKNQLRAFINTMNASRNAPVFIFGSVFGGTGASSIPVIPKALNEAARVIGGKSSGNLTENLHFGTIVLSNYFRFDINTQDKVCAKSDDFAINSQSALSFYNEDQTVKSTYKRMYLLGRPKSEDLPDVTAKGSKGVTGGKEQKNPADNIELIAAMAAYDFFKEADRETPFQNDPNPFFCIGTGYCKNTQKIGFDLFAQDDASLLKKKFGCLVAASLLDKTKDFFTSMVQTKNMFTSVEAEGDGLRSLKEYFSLFNIGVASDGNLTYGWLQQMYNGRGGEGILFNKAMFECRTEKDLGKLKFNKELFADADTNFSVGMLSNIVSEVRDRFIKVKPELKNTLEDLIARTYATLTQLYFNE